MVLAISLQDIKHFDFFLFSDKIPIFQGNLYVLAIFPLILVFCSISITTRKNNLFHGVSCAAGMNDVISEEDDYHHTIIESNAAANLSNNGVSKTKAGKKYKSVDQNTYRKMQQKCVKFLFKIKKLIKVHQ